uniref:Protein kinase domain-containing protein n=3 Tax=Rhizophora mucronata TaxID=61149 RepID=A0A2P2KTN3_RHIMU
MGCVSSKQPVSETPAIDHLGGFNSGLIGGHEKSGGHNRKSYRFANYKENAEVSCRGSKLGESGRVSANGDSLSFRLRNLHKYVEGEQVAAGWPAWLSAVAGEAIHGWVPLKADAFEKLEKIGQGTYSSVFRARELETGRMVALKKVRFDNFEPESVRFMAREILIIRRLNHPNIIKLDGLITSRLSCSIYLVFEYMEHDLTGLLSCPEVMFSEPQIKCYMKQLLSGLEHCHSMGVMHRDIKGSNLLVNNEGILKVGDFGLANFCNIGCKQPLTSRVVTLWYRPPELLLGSTDYGASVDLWSVGCIFAELLIGKPILQGRTEVEQLHKIFKLCGSPRDEYWRKSKLPHATLFKPQQPYDSCLHEIFKDLPKAAVNLIETFLSVEPDKRGSASSALASEYFMTKPYACDPSSLPTYPPSKEIDAKNREDAKRKKIRGRGCGVETRRPTRKLYGTARLAPAEDAAARVQSNQNIANNAICITKGGDGRQGRKGWKSSLDKVEEIVHARNASQGDIPFSGRLEVSSSSGFAWAKMRKEDASVGSYSQSISRGQNINELETSFEEMTNFDSRRYNDQSGTYGTRTGSRVHDALEMSKHALHKRWSQFGHPDSFDTSGEYHSQELSLALHQREEMEAKRNNLGFQDQVDKVEFSGPLLLQTHRIDELLERRERRIRQTVRKSWFRKGKKHEQ